MWNGEVSTCAVILPGAGEVSVYWTVVIPSREVTFVIATEWPALGRVPRKTATSMNWDQSISGGGTATALCARQSSRHASAS